MLTQDWLTDAVLYLYALSLLFFASDAASGNRKAKKVGTGLLVFVWVLQTVFLLMLLASHLGEPAWLTLKEYLFFVSWLLVSVSFLLYRWVRAEILVLLVNAVGFGVLALNLIERQQREIGFATQETAKRLLIVHVSLITLAFAVLTVSALLGAMHVFLHRRLKKKKWSHMISRMPSLEWMDRFSYRACAIGLPLLLLALSTGTIALLATDTPLRLLDLKVVLSYLSGLVYMIYFFRRIVTRDDGNRLAIWNLLGYALLIADFFASSLSSFHRWF
jgi:HemX protein